MGGRIKTKSSKSKSEHATKLDALETALADTTAAKRLGELARDFHMVVYSLGHDIGAIIRDPDIVDRAARGKVLANERASAAYERDGNIKHAMFHLFEGLDAGPTRADRDRLAASLARLLDTHGPAAATQRAVLAKLPTADDKARDKFHAALERVKYALDWETLPTG